jgi:DNA-binding transcriptional MocR family regulator
LLPASGTPSAPREVSPAEQFRYDLRPGQADFHAFPRAQWKASLVRALRELPDRRLGYANHRGVAELRDAVAGYLAPPSHLIDDVENVLLVTGVTPPTLDQTAMASFIDDAGLERHLRSMRRRYRAKREVLIDALATQPAALPGTYLATVSGGNDGRAQVTGVTGRRPRAGELFLAARFRCFG